MKTSRAFFSLISFSAAVSVAFADTHTWVAGSSTGGGWGVATNWINDTTQENECPEAGDVATFNNSVTNVVSDADAPLACSMKLIKLDSAKLVFDVSADFDVQCAIRGNGNFVKRGTGSLVLLSEDQTNISATYNFWPVYSVNGGWLTVEEGAVAMPTNKTINYLVSSLAVSNGASFLLPNNKSMCLCRLSGDGDVALPDDASSNVTLQFGHPADRTLSGFSGRILKGNSGKTLSVSTYAPLHLLGVANDFTSVTGMKYKGVEEDAYGMVSARKLGAKGSASSVGLGDVGMEWCGGFTYVGDALDETDRSFWFDFRSDDNKPCAAVLDGGAYGGLVCNGSISYLNSGSKDYMGVLTLRGSNAVPCVIGGDFIGSITPAAGIRTLAIVKKGSGVWRFAEKGKSRTQRGAYEIEQGTLQFESIAETNTTCSLGLSTMLQSAYVGAYDQGRTVAYAFKLGSETSTNAVFEYCGATAASCATRPLALSGDGHLRANGALNAPIDFSGVSVLASGDRTLVLDGTNTEENVLREVTDGNQGGCLSLVKDGPGTWYLKDNQTFSGDLTVKGGTLVVSHSPVIPYRWFRIQFPDGYDQTKVWYLREVALYDAEGIRRNAGLSFSKPTGAPASGNYSGWEPASLEPNSATYADKITYYIYTDYVFTNVFDNASTMMCCSQSFNSSVKPRLVMRLADDCPEIVSVDIAQYSNDQTPNALVLQGSVDGQTWNALVSTNGLQRKSDKWYFSTNLSSLGGTVPRKLSEGEGLGFDTRAGIVNDRSVLENVNTYSVAPGATLTTEGTVSPVISKLSVDGLYGAGTISGNFRFANNVTLDIVGAAKGRATLPHGFSGVAGFKDVNWTVTFDGGDSKCSARVTESGIDILPSGILVIFR